MEQTQHAAPNQWEGKMEAKSGTVSQELATADDDQRCQSELRAVSIGTRKIINKFSEYKTNNSKQKHHC